MKKKHAKKHIQEKPAEAAAPAPEEMEEPQMPEEMEEPQMLDVAEMPVDPQPEKDRKLTALWLAVGGSVAVIVALWFMLLPMQIGELRLPSAKDLDRWHTLKPAADTVKSFDENLRLIRERLGQLTNSTQAPAPANKPATVVDIEQLRQKLEAASQRIESQATNTNEAKK